MARDERNFHSHQQMGISCVPENLMVTQSHQWFLGSPSLAKLMLRCSFKIHMIMMVILHATQENNTA